MNEINGLRLAYRGFVAGLAGGYIWAALAMTMAGLLHADPLRPLRPIALAITPLAGSSELGFVVGLAAVQAGGGLTGMLVAYFVARYFTVRPMLVAAAPLAALLVWMVTAVVVAADTSTREFASAPIPIVATIGYGLLLGVAVPVRGEVARARQPGSPST